MVKKIRWDENDTKRAFILWKKFSEISKSVHKKTETRNAFIVDDLLLHILQK